MHNVAGLLAAGATREPGGPAWTFGDRSAGYADLRDRVAGLAAGLVRMGLKPGDRLVLLLPNAPELVETLFAAFWAGLVAVPLNWHLHPQEVSYVVGHCGAGAVLVAPETAAAAEGLPAGTHVLHAGDGPGTDLADVTDTPIAMAETAPDDPAWLFYTSGTTGRPKGATLTHRNLLGMTLRYYADIDRVAPGSVFVHAAPLTHGSGLYLLPAVGRAAHNVISTARGFDAGDYLALLAHHGASHAAFVAPTMLKRMVLARGRTGHDLSALRSIVVGGAPLYLADLRAATAAFGPVVTQIYGQGESPMTITVMPPATAAELDADPDRALSCGRAFTGVEVRVVDPGGRPVPAGVDGEVCVRGDVVMRGYWADAAATDGALRDGWLHTGDLGHLDAGGHLHLTDRAKDVIITGGSNVYPREVEEVLLTHPDVREVAVIGRPDPDWGESVCAFVVAEPDRTRPDPAALVAHCRDRLASFKKPKEIVFIDALPKSAAGKILKRELRGRAPGP
ncbi:MAG: class I adenylate-forming enzyme family protein [Pseudonocardia sp.]